MSILKKVEFWRSAGPDRTVRIDGDKQEVRLYEGLTLKATLSFEDRFSF